MKIRFIIIALLCCVSYCSKAIIYRHDVPLSSFTELAKAPAFNCVGLVYRNMKDSNRQQGSCVLIADRYVLTALHVMNPHDIDAGIYQISFNGIMYGVASYRTYPQNGHDMLLLKLDASVQGIAAAILDTVNVILYDTVTMVGYGGLRPSDMLNGSMGLGVKTAAQNIIDSVGGGVSINNMPARLYADFDGPMSEQDNPLPLEGLLNGGDSGGGMFVFKNGKYYLAGIAKGTRMQLSSTTGYDGSTMHWSSISSYYSWISYAINDMEGN